MINNRNFRLDIQILRGIAVLYVILFHLDLELFKSGFLGVDVFFVISGFLMSILYKDSNALDFYKKRAKRLLPGYYFTMFLAIFIAVFVVNPIDFKELLKETLFASLFLSNIGFLNMDSYYSTTQFRPLLHFWSLSVEIQFYLLFPLLYYIARKNIINVYLIFGISFFLCLLLVFIESSKSSFFLMPTRIWEFFLGYIAATYFNINSQPRIRRPKIGLLGLIIVISIPFIDVDGQSSSIMFGHPAMWAGIICVATGLILAYGIPLYIEKSIIGTTLIQVGKYSYSAYLAHFIVIIFYNYQPFADSSIHLNSYFSIINNIILIILLTLIIYHFAEKPFYRKQFSYTYLATPVVILMLGLILKPLQLKVLPEKERLLYSASLTYSSGRCNAWQQLKSLNKDICYLNYIDNQHKNVLLIGDSHAGAIRHAFSEIATKHGYNTFFTKKNGALTKNKLTLQQLSESIIDNDIHSVVLHYSTGNLLKDNNFLLDNIIKLRDILTVKDISISFIMPTPEMTGIQPLKEIYTKLKNNKMLSFITLNNYKVKNYSIKSYLNMLKTYDVAYLFCDQNCIMLDELHRPIYVDAGHLTITGAKKLIPIFNKIFKHIANTDKVKE